MGGIAQGKEGNYINEKILPVECGVNRVLIRSTNRAGKVLLTAKAAGFKEAVLSLESKSVSQKNGLSTYVSGDYQPSNLSRGETPSTPSYTIKKEFRGNCSGHCR